MKLTLGTRATRRAIKSRGWKITWVVSGRWRTYLAEDVGGAWEGENLVDSEGRPGVRASCECKPVAQLKRALDGNASSEKALTVGKMTGPLAEMALDIIENKG